MKYKWVSWCWCGLWCTVDLIYLPDFVLPAPVDLRPAVKFGVAVAGEEGDLGSGLGVAFLRPLLFWNWLWIIVWKGQREKEKG